MQAKTARVLVLVSATILMADNSKMLDNIKKKLNVMFQEPEKHVVIGITKTRTV